MEAQCLGFAESDPTNDVDGIDAAYKWSSSRLSVWISVWRCQPPCVRNITPEDVAVAQDLGYVVKFGRLTRGNAIRNRCWSNTDFLAKAHLLAGRKRRRMRSLLSQLALRIHVLWPRCRSKPTATSVVADIVRIVRRLNEGTIGKAFNEFSRDLSWLNPRMLRATVIYLGSRCQRSSLAFGWNLQCWRSSFKQILQEGGWCETVV